MVLRERATFLGKPLKVFPYRVSRARLVNVKTFVCSPEWFPQSYIMFFDVSTVR